MDGIDDPLDFKSSHLQTLDENLRCPICKEFYDTAMILSTCSHSFCAICIRRSLASEQCCPKCRTPSHDSNLHNNYDMDNVIHAWKQSRKTILDLEALDRSPPTDQPSSQNEQDEDFLEAPSSSSRRSARLRTTTSKSEGKVVNNTRWELTSDGITTLFSVIDPELVTCPVCQQRMQMAVLNQHVDSCLNGDSTIPPLPVKASIPTLGKKTINTGKKPVKIVYDMYKDKDLRRMLKEYDLPDHGDKAQLIWRYKEYVTMYNANMDSSDPVDISQLIRQLQTTEKLYSTRNLHKRSAPDTAVHNILFLSLN
ncbi:hypothetical protein [Absidia glauca]|uniref:Postreplication repair E3 ubiquitin-protein ligase RAD18 n=1 Tax=Absidia glauca TaxID=4829 RepID=A0A163KAE1_ABSGL|nr:hypothetical protein [Absidia glauca]